jgi:hypothetical protein
VSDGGINFRDTAGFVTDGTNETYCLGEVDAYPVSRGGLTFGWETIANDAGRDRNSGIDRRLAGVNFDGANAPAIFRLNLPSTGTYLIELAVGDTGGFNPPVQDAQIVDDTTTFITVTQDPNDTNWIDATNVIRTSASDWTTNQTAVSRTMASAILRAELRNSGVGPQRIAHLAFTAQGVARPPRLRKRFFFPGVRR